MAALWAESAGTLAQPSQENTIHLELRVQPQVGLPADPGGVVDVPGSVHLPITAPGQLRRFEVQYRLLDLEPTDAIVPLSIASFQFTIAFTGGGDASLERAILSGVEANGRPPQAFSPDLSGGQIGSFASPYESRGLHHAFLRDHGSVFQPPSNDGGENGLFAAGPGGPRQALRQITPIRLSEDPALQLGAWYGLYSFNLISGPQLGTDVTMTASVLSDGAGLAFGFYADTSGIPWVSNNATSTPAFIPVPAPAASALAAVAVTVIVGQRRRRAYARSSDRPMR